MLSILRSLKAFIITVLKDRQFWYTVMAEASFAISQYLATKKSRKGRRLK